MLYGSNSVSFQFIRNQKMVTFCSKMDACSATSVSIKLYNWQLECAVIVINFIPEKKKFWPF